MSRVILLSVLSTLTTFISNTSFAERVKPITFYDDAKFVYDTLARKGAKEEDSENGPDKVKRVSAIDLLCNVFSAPDEKGRPVAVFRWEFNVNGEKDPRILGGLDGGDTFYKILARVLKKEGHLSMSQLQCIKYPKDEKGRESHACIVVPF